MAEKKTPPPNNQRQFAVWGIIIMLLLIVFAVSQSNTGAVDGEEFTFSDFQSRVEAGEIKSAKIDIPGGEVTGELSNGEDYLVNVPPVSADPAGTILKDSGIPYEYAEKTEPSFLGSILLSILPLLIIIGLFFLVFRNMQGGGRGGARVVRSRRSGPARCARGAGAADPVAAAAGGGAAAAHA